jgi:galactoside O-acetyltransferase
VVKFGTPNTASWKEYKQFASIHPTCIIAPQAGMLFTVRPEHQVVNLTIDEGSHVYSMFNFLRPDAKISIGKRCQLGNVNFVSAKEITVGDDVLMAWGINILDSNHHSLYWEERKNDVQRCREDYITSNGRSIGASMDWDTIDCRKVVIKDKVWLGFNVSILKGVTIGEGAIIAPGSMVTRDVRPWTMGGGNPFRHIKEIPRSRPVNVNRFSKSGLGN